MKHANQAKYLALAVLCALSMAACSNPFESRPAVDAERPAAATANQVSKEELATWLDWAAELRNQMTAAMSEARQVLNDNDNEAYLAMFERRRQEQTELVAREPFKGTPKGQAINGVIEALYASGTYFKDDKELEKVRARDGKELVDSILKHESLIREKLDPDGLNVWKRALVQ
jgi:DNA-binding transcriptional regulator YdaS (Cro superfamily)